jgi:hypothetical protein
MVGYPVSREDLEAARRLAPEHPVLARRWTVLDFTGCVFARLESEARELHAVVTATLEG